MKKICFYLATAFLALPGMQQAHAQSVTSAASKVFKTTANHLRGLDLEGTWAYEGIAVKFKSDNLLKKAGGAAAASQIEKKLDKQLEKAGFEPGVTTFTFNENGTFKQTTKGKAISGKYEYDPGSGEIKLKYLNHLPMSATVHGSGNKIEFLFEANSFLSFVGFIGSHSGVSILKSVSSIVNSYDGMMVGLELHKK